jgi:two-component system sensor histidine kinase BaeS
LSRLVNDLHELALSDARQLALHRQPVDLAALLIDAIVIFEAVAESEGVTVDVQVSQPPPPRVEADPVRLKQVIHNLLVNALRHTAAGGRIALELTAQVGGVQLAIQDTGVGIPANHLPHIFERFYRVDPARGRETGGTGLGLAIVRALIEAHGGTISVYSRTGENAGTTFTIFLPDAYAYEQQS